MATGRPGRQSASAGRDPRANGRYCSVPWRHPGRARKSTADANPITADLEDVIVRQQGVADQGVVDADAFGPEQIDDPQAHRAPEQAAMEWSHAGVGQPELASPGRADQRHHSIHRPACRPRGTVEEFQGDLGQWLAGVRPCNERGDRRPRGGTAVGLGRGAPHQALELEGADPYHSTRTQASRTSWAARLPASPSGCPGRSRMPAPPRPANRRVVDSPACDRAARRTAGRDRSARMAGAAAVPRSRSGSGPGERSEAAPRSHRRSGIIHSESVTRRHHRGRLTTEHDDGRGYWPRRSMRWIRLGLEPPILIRFQVHIRSTPRLPS